MHFRGFFARSSVVTEDTATAAEEEVDAVILIRWNEISTSFIRTLVELNWKGFLYFCGPVHQSSHGNNINIHDH